MESERAKARATGRSGDLPASHELPGVQAFLEAQSHSELVRLIVEFACLDPDLEQELILDAAIAQRGAAYLAIRIAIHKATRMSGAVDRAAMSKIVQRIEAISHTLAKLVDDGHQNDALDLCELLLSRTEEVIGKCDDSDGHLDTILRELQALHLRACTSMRPAGRALAEKLFHLAIRSDRGVFLEAAIQYASLLGTEGLARYRELAEEYWRALPTLEPGEGPTPGERHRTALTRIVESLAEASGDLDARIAVMSKDLSTARGFQRIGEVLQKAGRSDEAIEWLHRGVAAFGELQDPHLVDTLIQLLVEEKQFQEAIELAWRRFDEVGDLVSYQLLHAAASPLGRWKEIRARALYLLQPPIAGSKVHPSGKPWCNEGTLVEIYLWERDIEAAWCCAKEQGCPDLLWLDLAREREETHPAECAPIYERAAERALERRDKASFHQAIMKIEHVHSLRVRSGEMAAFEAWLKNLRQAHGGKLSFIAMLEQRFPTARK